MASHRGHFEFGSRFSCEPVRRRAVDVTVQVCQAVVLTEPMPRLVVVGKRPRRAVGPVSVDGPGTSHGMGLAFGLCRVTQLNAPQEDPQTPMVDHLDGSCAWNAELCHVQSTVLLCYAPQDYPEGTNAMDKRIGIDSFPWHDVVPECPAFWFALAIDSGIASFATKDTIRVDGYGYDASHLAKEEGRLPSLHMHVFHGEMLHVLTPFE